MEVVEVSVFRAVPSWWRRAERPAAGAGAEPERAPQVVEAGSFTHGVCPDCAWRGPGRRSRGQARDDASGHERQCGGAAAGEIPTRATTDA